MNNFFLPDHVHFCYRGDAVVFLDLEQDDYIFMGPTGAAALRCLSSLETAVLSAEQHVALSELLDGGLLTTDRTRGRAIAPTRMMMATQSLLEGGVTMTGRISHRYLLNFFAASAEASIRLRWGQLHKTVAHVRRRKANHESGTLIDVERCRQLVAVFASLRPFFPRRYLCLYDSLALIEFLARYRIFPVWIFGVRLEPWAAHCWVQHDGYIFNEDIEVAAGYTPVMVI